MAAYLIFTADHEYFALATNEATRDAFLLELAISDHREGYAEPYDNYVRPECRETRTPEEIAEGYRLIALDTARRLGDAALVAKLEAAYVSEKAAAE
jgi:hypothetical protein